jgi:hypothetical protein
MINEHFTPKCYKRTLVDVFVVEPYSLGVMRYLAAEAVDNGYVAAVDPNPERCNLTREIFPLRS